MAWKNSTMLVPKVKFNAQKAVQHDRSKVQTSTRAQAAHLPHIRQWCFLVRNPNFLPQPWHSCCTASDSHTATFSAAEPLEPPRADAIASSKRANIGIHHFNVTSHAG